MGADRTVKVYAVDKVAVLVSKTAPPMVCVHADGRAQTSGWGGGSLVPQSYAKPPPDGIRDFDFLGERPSPGGAVLNVLTPISAHMEILGIDIANYWGKGLPLKGVRVHAASNQKTIEIVTREEAAAINPKMPRAIAAFISSTDSEDVPGFEADIKPLFRDKDVEWMKSIANFDLRNYEDVKARAGKILRRLRTNMPCDGPWPDDDIEKFRAWKDGGMPA